MREPVEKDALSELFVRYRAACPEVEPGAGFMPALWERIEARRSFAWKLRYYARALVTVTAALYLAAGLIGSFGDRPVNPIYTESYVEALYAAEAPENLAYADVIRTEYPSSDVQ
jgi:hypothetical protein